ncbi:hypothetical protein ZEAMMB73_Zm00001d028119 [Zea mays]|uniref:Uncharacterized protein n=1 Tax=Zea mays TaxID=4577 RepID=A0A1D6JS71_MAIZE|nr:hypothetical protein ZEAMMB73_Zm00001d028119 [Zea mays]
MEPPRRRLSPARAIPSRRLSAPDTTSAVMGNLQGLNGATVGFSAAGGPEEATEEEDMRGCKGCARRWPKSGLSWGCARSRRWRRGESLHHTAHVTKARPPISVTTIPSYSM